MSLNLEERGRQLEWAFFAELDAGRAQALRAEYAALPPAKAVHRATGLTDAALQEELVELAIAPATLLAMTVVPLLEVAWADGAIQDGERTALLSAAAAHGFPSGGVEHELLGAWLARKPGADLLDAWVGYISALVEHLSAADRKRLMAAVVDQARAIAKAAGGLLGLASVSAREDLMLQRLEYAFKFPEQFKTVFAK